METTENGGAGLQLWQRRLEESRAASAAEYEKMEERERMYAGCRELRPLVPGDVTKSGRARKTSHIRNIIFENIETQVSTSVPLPKVTARRKKDERLAALIEHFLRGELDRLPFEQINDIAERTVPIQGGVGFLVEWDNSAVSHGHVGELSVTVLHPRQIAPQPGVFTSVEDMDWFILCLPTTRGAVERRFGKKIASSAAGNDPVLSDEEGTDSEKITRYIGYERTADGIDMFSWAEDTVIEDIKNYQSRRRCVCQDCGCVPLRADVLAGRCPECGGKKFREELLEAEDGSWSSPVPYYLPGKYPLILQRSVSVYGKLYGNSDVDMIADQQNTVNRLEQKIIDRLIKAGTRITLPASASFRTDPDDGERWYLQNAADKSMIGVYDFKGDLQYELMYLANVYEEARQVLGITDSYQGRNDTTAISGVAKEFAAAQSAGRMESKRVMKNAAYAAVFELMFRFWLAYGDEPRQVSYRDSRGETVYEEISREDFLEKDEAGQYFWNDAFLFSCDDPESPAANREAMWQETRRNLESGAFGDPASPETLILFWTKMEQLHYPGASDTRAFLEQRVQRENSGGIPGELMNAIEEKALRDALNALGSEMSLRPRG